MIQELQLTKNQKYNLLLTLAINAQMSVVNQEPHPVWSSLMDLEAGEFAEYDEQLYKTLKSLGDFSLIEVFYLITQASDHLRKQAFQEKIDCLSDLYLRYVADHINRIETRHKGNTEATLDSLKRIAYGAEILYPENDDLTDEQQAILWDFIRDFKFSIKGRAALENVRNCPKVTQEV